MASIKLKGDTSGEVIISAPSVAGNTTLELPATSSTLATQNSLGNRNLIVNGDMRIDQRNAGASNTSNSNTYMVDRFEFQMSNVTNVQTYQQVGDAPAGFNKSLKITNNSTTQSAGTNVLSTPRQKIEGFNTAHLNWGTADAQTVTVSFWVKASVTGTYAVALTNNGFSRSFVTNYTVSVANTWEKKTVTISGDTSGTWTIDNSTGINVMFPLDTGTDKQTTADSWQTGNYRGTSSCVHFLANASATWQITGVQVEVNTTATPFEHLIYSQQLAMCQRYYQRFQGGGAFTSGVIGCYNTTTSIRALHNHIVPFRASPTFSYSAISHFDLEPFDQQPTSLSAITTGNLYQADVAATDPTARVGGYAAIITCDNSTGYFDFSAEL
jgi:hypothetical protein